MAMLGGHGLRELALCNVMRLDRLLHGIGEVPGAKPRFTLSAFNEVTIELNRPATEVLRELEELAIIGGRALDGVGMPNCLSIHVSELHAEADIDRLLAALRKILAGPPGKSGTRGMS
jgi:glycine cleavage system pyridoxal-binding protein P